MVAFFTKHIHSTAWSVAWNLFLITLGTVVFSIGFKAIVIPHGLITGGISGVSLLVYYLTNQLSPGVWYFIINVPIFLVGWLLVSRRFVLYSMFGVAAFSIVVDLIQFTIPIQEPFLAVLTGGTLIGAGTGIILHSLGSAGGTDIIAITLNQKYNLRMGTFHFTFNLILFAFSFGSLETDLVLYSVALSYVISQALEYVQSLSNQRKMVFIISARFKSIAAAIHHRLKRGATYLEGQGSYSGQDRKIIMTVVHNYQLKRLEEAVYSLDPDALVITENTFNVLGKGFSRRKVY